MKIRNVVLFKKDGLACWSVDRKLSSYAEDVLEGAERERVREHVRDCEKCSHRLSELRQVKGMVRGLGRVAPPRDLALSLRIVASRERARRISGRVLFDFEPLLMRVRNLMESWAAPSAGALVASVALFAMLIPGLPPPPVRNAADDLPTRIYTSPELKGLVAFSVADTEEMLLLDVEIDRNGRVTDYQVDGPNDPAMRRAIANGMLFTQFTPAMTFGQPVASRLRIPVQRDHIEVKG